MAEFRRYYRAIRPISRAGSNVPRRLLALAHQCEAVLAEVASSLRPGGNLAILIQD